jgi:O-antigen/teichoic acid export membrane protein
MLNINNKMTKNALIYIIGGGSTGLISYLLMPILTRYLSPADYGMVYMFLVLNMFFVSVIGLQADTYFARYYFEVEKTVFAEIMGGILKVILLSMITILGIILIFRHQLALALAISGNMLILSVIVATITFISVFILRYYQLAGKATQYIYVTLSMSTIGLLISLGLVVYFHMGWMGRIVGIIIPLILQAFISIFILYKNGLIIFELNFKHMRNIILFGLPLVLGSVSGWVINLADKIFITKMVSIAATGIYGIASSMGMIMGIIVDSCARAWVPYFFKNIRDNSVETNLKIVKVTYLYAISVIIMSFVVTLAAYIFIRYFLAKNYQESFNYVIWLSLGQGIAGIRSIFIYYLIYEIKNYVLLYMAIIIAVINIILNYILIKSFGAMGAAYTVFCCSLIALVLTIGASVYYHKMPWLFFLKKVESAQA